MRILALDVGERRIGVAVSDPSGTLASPLTTVQSIGPRRDIEQIAALAIEEKAERIVVGMPVSMDGVARAQAELVHEFCQRLREVTTIPIVTLDERLTTVEAERRMREAGASSRKRREQRDAMAAAVLLQAYLESMRPGTEVPEDG